MRSWDNWRYGSYVCREGHRMNMYCVIVYAYVSGPQLTPRTFEQDQAYRLSTSKTGLKYLFYYECIYIYIYIYMVRQLMPFFE